MFAIDRDQITKYNITDDSFLRLFLPALSVFYSHIALFFFPSFSHLFLTTFLTRCIFVSDSRRLCRCVGVSSRRDPAKRTPLPRASLTIRRDCRKIHDTRKSISTAVGSDGVSRKSHCIGAPTRGRKTDASFLLRRAREGTRRGEPRLYMQFCRACEFPVAADWVLNDVLCGNLRLFGNATGWRKRYYIRQWTRSSILKRMTSRRRHILLKIKIQETVLLKL